jgi:hypothetical protein
MRMVVDRDAAEAMPWLRYRWGAASFACAVAQVGWFPVCWGAYLVFLMHHGRELAGLWYAAMVAPGTGGVAFGLMALGTASRAPSRRDVMMGVVGLLMSLGMLGLGGWGIYRDVVDPAWSRIFV